MLKREIKMKRKLTEIDADTIYSDSILLQYALFDKMLEGTDNTADRLQILKNIQNLDFDTNPEYFYDSLKIATSTSKYKAYLLERSLVSLKKMKTFKLKNINAGFALKTCRGKPNFSKIVAVHNVSDVPNIGQALLIAATFLGGKYLDCSGTFLSEVLYKTAGFEEYKPSITAALKDGTIETIHFMRLKTSKKKV